jgi:putative ABC transport system substrate-binding protein
VSRRRFLMSAAAGAFAAGLPHRLAAAAGVKRVAVLYMLDVEEGVVPKDFLAYIQAKFVGPFAELGLRDGVNLELVPYIVPARSDWEEREPKAVRDIARGRCDGVILERSFLVHWLQKAAPNLPIVVHVFDPVGEGFAQSLARPGGNVTGTHRGVREIFFKQIDVLRRLVPGATRMAWISFRPQLKERWAAFEWAARTAGMEFRQVILEPTKDDDFPGLAGDFEALRRDGYRCGHFNGIFEPDLKAVSALALRHQIALSFWGSPQDFDRDGLLLQYRSLPDGVEKRQVATMARILRGEHPRGIPFEGPTKYQMRLNLKTAARIGLKVPADMLVMMDEVLR